ncbi:glutathione S-transferase, partial [Phascolomyces articulosus]
SVFGFGEPIKLLLEDAKVPHEYTQLTLSEMSEIKPKLIAAGNHFGAVPAIDFGDGEYNGASIPLLRLLTRKLGKYVKYTNDEKEEYFLDSASDFSIDWHLTAGETLFNQDDPTKREEYKTKVADKHYSRFDYVYGLHDGPYILGNEITYVDFLTYHIIDSDARNKCSELLKKYPNLIKLVEAIKNRPNLQSHFKSLAAKENQ